MTSLPQIRDRGVTSNGIYIVLSPDGTAIQIPRELFFCADDFLVTRKDAGSMVVHFRNGGVAD